MKNLTKLALMASLAFPFQAFGSGFEKAVSWSASNSAVSGAVASHVKGADSLFFNPAGLAGGEGQEVSASITAIRPKFKGPITKDNEQLSSKSNTVTPFGALYSFKISDKLGAGFGVYSAGGSKVTFTDVDYSSIHSNFALKEDVLTDLSIIEAALGLGYQLTSNLRVGAAWRIAHVKGHFSSSKVTYGPDTTTPVLLTHIDIDNVKDTRYNGFKVGAQYLTDDEKFGLGFVWRTEIKFRGKGKTTGKYNSVSSSTVNDFSSVADAEVANTFPHQLELDAHYSFETPLTLFAGVVFTEYSKNEFLEIEGYSNVTGSGETNIPDIYQGWKNQWNYRLGLESKHLEKVALRAGYILTTQVTSEYASRATFVAPAKAHTFVVGAGTSLMDDKLDLDLAIEHTTSKGRGATPDESSSSTLRTPAKSGQFKTSSFGALLSAKYHF